LHHGVGVHDVFVAEDLDDAELTDALEAGSISPWIVARDVIEVLTDTVTPQGVVAVVEAPLASLEAISGADLVLVLADVRDPGNAGTLVRCAAAAGAGAVVFAQGSVDPLHPKVVRSAAGALFRVPIVRSAPLEDVEATLRDAGAAILGTDARSESEIYDVDLTGPTALVLGNEAWGLSDEAARMVDRTASIPMPGPVESLNVSTAGAVVLFEALRQRRKVAVRGLLDGESERGGQRRQGGLQAPEPDAHHGESEA
jgi:TrmH family RNA methyltransferase